MRRVKTPKITRLLKVDRTKVGRIMTNNVHLEPHEYETMRHLALYGFNIEVIKPGSTPKVKNSDILMLGTIWEIKTPTTHNIKTLKKRVHQASLQAQNVVFDLRKVRKNYTAVEAYLVKTFTANGALRRMMLITNMSELLDIRK